MPVLANDTDPEGDRLRLVADSLDASDGVEAEIDVDRVVVTAPSDPGTYAVRYTVSDGFSTATAAVVVEVSADAVLLPPIARDDVLAISDIAGQAVVHVSVLDNDEDPDGTVDDLTVSAPAPDVTGSSRPTCWIPPR